MENYFSKHLLETRINFERSNHEVLQGSFQLSDEEFETLIAKPETFKLGIPYSNIVDCIGYEYMELKKFDSLVEVLFQDKNRFNNYTERFNRLGSLHNSLHLEFIFPIYTCNFQRPKFHTMSFISLNQLNLDSEFSGLITTAQNSGHGNYASLLTNSGEGVHDFSSSIVIPLEINSAGRRYTIDDVLRFQKKK